MVPLPSVAEELLEALRNVMMVVIEGIEKLEKEYLIVLGKVWSARRKFV